MNLPKTIKGDLIDLEKVSMKYLSDFHKYSTMDDLYLYLEFDTFKNIDETSLYLNKLIKRSKKNNAQYWFIKLKNEDKVVGTFGLLNIDFYRKSAEIGYGVSPEFWGRGIFKNSCKLILKHMFNTLNFHKIFAITDCRNINSISSLEKIGFKFEAKLRDYYFYKNEKWVDAQVLSIFDYDYKDLYQ